MIDYSIGSHISSSKNVVLIHGLFGDKNNLNTVKKALLPHFNVMTLDLPNHGKSAHVDEWQFESVIKSIHHVLEDEQFYPCSIVGHSLGGKVAMGLALSYADKISNVVVADIAPSAYPRRHDTVFKALKAVDNTHITSRKQAADVLDTILVEAGVSQFLLKSFKLIDNQWQWIFNLSGLERDYANIIAWPYQEQVFKGNVLFIKGERSDYITTEHRANILKHFPQASYKIIKNTGHWLHAEKPDLFNRLVLAAL